MAQSPPKPTRGRKSPPARYGGLPIAPTLEGIPVELRGKTLGYVGDRDVATMQRLSRSSLPLSRHQMRELCDSLPTEKELGAYVEERRQMRLTPFRVAVYSATSAVYDEYGTVLASAPYVVVGRINEVAEGSRYSFMDVYDVGTSEDEETEEEQVHDQDEEEQGYAGGRANPFASMHVLVSDEALVETGSEGIRMVTEHLSRGIPDPATVLGILRKRKSCRSRQRGEDGPDDYGLSAAINYTRQVLRPLLVRLVGERDVDLLYDGENRGDIEDLLIPVGESQAELVAYRANLERVRLLVWGWLGAAPLDTVNEYDGTEDPVTASTLLTQATLLLQQYLSFDLQDTLDALQELEESPSFPTDREIIDWVEERRKRGETLTVSFLVPADGRIVAVKVLALTVSGWSVAWKEYEATAAESRWSSLRALTDKERTESPVGRWDAVVRARRLPGDVDPHTALEVMRSRAGVTESDGRYGIETVRQYLRERLDTTPYLGTVVGHLTSLYDLSREAQIDQVVEEVFATPTEIGSVSRVRVFHHGLQVLRLLAYLWLRVEEGGTAGIREVESVRRSAPPRDSTERTAERLETDVYDVLLEIRGYYSRLSEVAGGDLPSAADGGDEEGGDEEGGDIPVRGNEGSRGEDEEYNEEPAEGDEEL
jgi:hypothetical protein